MYSKSLPSFLLSSSLLVLPLASVGRFPGLAREHGELLLIVVVVGVAHQVDVAH